MDCNEINARVNKLHSELELIDSFERLYAEDEGSDDHVQIGRRARQLRRAEIETELRQVSHCFPITRAQLGSGWIGQSPSLANALE
jgi:hypothetical protein